MFFGDYLEGSSNIASNLASSASYSLAPTIIAIMMTLVGGFLALTGILLDSIGRMLNRIIINSQNGVNVSKATEPMELNEFKDITTKSK
jgi:hypothetical protein